MPINRFKASVSVSRVKVGFRERDGLVLMLGSIMTTCRQC
jgi:hypothetical protein